MRLYKGSTDITDYVTQITWSGDYNNCCRTLDFGIISSETDKNIPVIDCKLMDGISFAPEKAIKFTGQVWKRGKQTGESSYDLTCYDKGFYMKKNTVSYRFSKMTPERIVKKLCEDYGIKIGKIAQTGYIFSRNFFGCSIYDIIMTAYTLASKKTGKKYQAYFIGNEFNVIERGTNTDRVILNGGINLMSASISESAENVVTRVKIYSQSDNFVKNVDNSEAMKIYGLLQRYVKQSKDDNGTQEANDYLKEGKIEQKITVNNIGDIRCISGNSIIVREPYTGVYGLFYIDGDSHTWKNGQYYNKLTLNFERIMDEKEVGDEAANKKESGGSSSTGSSISKVSYKSSAATDKFILTKGTETDYYNSAWKQIAYPDYKSYIKGQIRNERSKGNLTDSDVKYLNNYYGI